MSSSIMLCYTPTQTSNMPPEITHILPFCGSLAVPYFVMKCTLAGAVRRPPGVWKFYGSLTILHFPTGGANDAVSLRVYYRGEIRLLFTLRTIIALHYSLAYYLSYLPYWPSDYYLSETYVLATAITQNGCTDI